MPRAEWFSVGFHQLILGKLANRLMSVEFPFFFFWDSIYLLERELTAEGEGKSRLPTEQGPQSGTQSQDPGIMT